MIISASIQAANQLFLLEEINNNKNKFDQIHIDITDGHFTNNISMSFNHINLIKKNTDYKVDVHLMLDNNDKFVKVAFANGADLVYVHQESTTLESFIELQNVFPQLGVATLPNTQNETLKDYLKYAKAVLLLGVTPGYSNQKQSIDLLEKAKNFKNQYKDYSGLLVLDGGITNDDLQKFKNLDIDIVIQGGAIFG
jgi:ribulose-phosphate 3-epimerase